MIRFHWIEIDNFVIFPHLELYPSINPDKPLTIIRAENGSGKTSLLRAIKWCLYGEKGLPTHEGVYPIHLQSLDPTERDITTRVSIEFKVDTSSSTFRLQRSAVTSKNPIGGVQNFVREKETATLLEKKRGQSKWTEVRTGLDSVIQHYMPWGLRNFFIMDTDEVADYVGGAENVQLSQKSVRELTTSAILSVLGLDVCKSAQIRMQRIADDYERETARITKSQQVVSVQRDLENARETATELGVELLRLDTERQDLDAEIGRLQAELDHLLISLENESDLQRRRHRNSQEVDLAIRELAEKQIILDDIAHSKEIYAALARGHIDRTVALLKPKFKSGEIAFRHIPFVRELLENGQCVCGEDLARTGSHRRKVQSFIRKVSKQEETAEIMTNVFEAARNQQILNSNNRVLDRIFSAQNSITSLEKRVSDLETEKRELEDKLDQLDSPRIKSLRELIQSRNRRVMELEREIGSKQIQMEQEIRIRDSLQKELQELLRKQVTGLVTSGCHRVASLMLRVFERTYQAITKVQIPELSEQMNRFFLQMAANVADTDFVNIDTQGKSIRMIEQVKIEKITGGLDQFEIKVLNSRGETLGPTQINGASRRIIALAFVLAMCEGSQSHTPLVADSLLNFMSGRVRTNTLRIINEHSDQPILLLTGSDLGGDEEMALVREFGGAFYTLTGQWDAIDAGHGGDVVNLTENTRVSLLCECDPRQFCSICERSGQRGRVGWEERV